MTGLGLRQYPKLIPNWRRYWKSPWFYKNNSDRKR